MSSIAIKEQIELGECISSIDFSPSGEYVAVGLVDESVRVWKADFVQDVSKQKLFQFEGHMMGVVDIKFNSTGSSNIRIIQQQLRIAVNSLDSMIRVWNVDDGEKVCEIQCSPNTQYIIKIKQVENWKLAFRETYSLLTTGEQGRTLIGSIQTRDIFSTAIATSKDQSKLVAVGNNDGQIFIIDYTNNKHVTTSNFHDKKVNSICFSKDDKKLLTASDDGSAKLVDLNKNEVIFTFNGHQGNVNCVDYCPIDEKLFVTWQIY